MQQRVASAIAVCLAVTLAGRAASAQNNPLDTLVRVHVITLDSTWYVTDALVSITGDSVVVRTDSGRTRAAFERIHVLSVERRGPAAGFGHSALNGCAIVGGGLGLLGVLGTVFGDKSGGDGDEQGIAAMFTAALFVGGCALGAVIGGVASTAHQYTWTTITMPPRTGTEVDTSDVRVRGAETPSRGPSRSQSTGELSYLADRYHVA